MKTFYFIMGLMLLFQVNSLSYDYSSIKISEVVYSSGDKDWIEIKCISNIATHVDISQLYVTMYYGLNENISEKPVSLFSYDRPETPFDDRYAVIYPSYDGNDETDLTGDLNKNRILELYCNSNPVSLWNGEGVVAIDTNDDPEDGMIDFVFYSDIDGTINSTVKNYVQNAISFGQWINESTDLQNSAVKVNDKRKYVSIIRISHNDTNRSDDFKITESLTPGYTNILNSRREKNKKIFTIENKKHIFRCNSKTIQLRISVRKRSDIEARIFTSYGMMTGKSEKKLFQFSGIDVIHLRLKKRPVPGLYIIFIEAHDKTSGNKQTEKFPVVFAN